jgi:hypothetical protein
MKFKAGDLIEVRYWGWWYDGEVREFRRLNRVDEGYVIRFTPERDHHPRDKFFIAKNVRAREGKPREGGTFPTGPRSREWWRHFEVEKGRRYREEGHMKEAK